MSPSRSHSSPRLIAIAVVLDQEKVLVGRREGTGELDGYCEFPGGKQQPGETAEAAAVRECREETGLEVTPVRCLETVRHTYEFGELHLSFVECRLCRPEENPRPPFQWLARRELDPARFPPANRSVITQLKNRK